MRRGADARFEGQGVGAGTRCAPKRMASNEGADGAASSQSTCNAHNPHQRAPGVHAWRWRTRINMAMFQYPYTGSFDDAPARKSSARPPLRRGAGSVPRAFLISIGNNPEETPTIGLHMRRRRLRRDRLRLRTLSNATAIIAFPAAFAGASGHPVAQTAFGAVLLTGIVLAFLQYGRGYNRAMLVHLGCTAVGFGAGNFAWPALLA